MKDKARANLYIKEAERSRGLAAIRALSILSNIGKVEKGRLLSMCRQIESSKRADALLFAAWRADKGIEELVVEYLKHPQYSPYLAHVLTRLAKCDHVLALIAAKSIVPTSENALQLTMTFAGLAKMAAADNLEFFELAKKCAALASDRCLALNLLLAEFDAHRFAPAGPLDNEIAQTRCELSSLLAELEDAGARLAIEAQQSEDPLFAEAALATLTRLEEMEAAGEITEHELSRTLSYALGQAAEPVKQDLARALMPRLRTIGDAHLRSELAYKAGLSTGGHQALSLYLKAIEYSRDINEAAPANFFLSTYLTEPELSATARRLDIQIKILSAINEISPGTARELLPEMLFQVGYLSGACQKIDYLLKFASLFTQDKFMAIIEIALKETLLFDDVDRLSSQAKITQILARLDFDLAGRLAKQIARESMTVTDSANLRTNVVLALFKTGQSIDEHLAALLSFVKNGSDFPYEIISEALPNQVKSILAVLDDNQRESVFEIIVRDFQSGEKAGKQPASLSLK